MMITPFRVVVADPPWAFVDRLPGKSRGAARNYNVMRWQSISMLKLPPIASDAHLFLWRVASMQWQAFNIANAWGFEVKSELVWLKRTANGKRHFGMGRQVRMEHEICLICTRGKGAGINGRSVRSTFEAKTGRHSEKPEEFYELVEKLCPNGPYLELFARKQRPGWTCLGNEVPGNTTTLGAA